MLRPCAAPDVWQPESAGSTEQRTSHVAASTWVLTSSNSRTDHVALRNISSLRYAISLSDSNLHGVAESGRLEPIEVTTASLRSKRIAIARITTTPDTL